MPDAASFASDMADQAYLCASTREFLDLPAVGTAEQLCC